MWEEQSYILKTETYCTIFLRSHPEHYGTYSKEIQLFASKQQKKVPACEVNYDVTASFTVSSSSNLLL